MAEQGESPPQGGIVQLVTPIQTFNEQLGAHLSAALQHQGTVAVLTTVVPGIGPERVVSVPLSAQQFHNVQAMLQQMMQPEALSAPVRRAMGFRVDDEE